MIKYMEEQNDIFIGHNTWFRYEAMSYRLLKNYRLNYHIIPSSSVIIPGHTVAMSSYAGTIAAKMQSVVCTDLELHFGGNFPKLHLFLGF